MLLLEFTDTEHLLKSLGLPNHGRFCINLRLESSLRSFKMCLRTYLPTASNKSFSGISVFLEKKNRNPFPWVGQAVALE